MCGRETQFRTWAAMKDAFMAEHVSGPVLPPRYNVAPTQDLYAVREDGDGRHLDVMRWGLVPAGSRGPGTRPWFNGRREQLDENSGAGRMYRKLIERRRCLVPFDYFYEWQERPGWRRKQPYAIGPAGDGPHAFAGVYDEWEAEDGSRLKSCLMFTTAANELMAWIHNSGTRKHRMPVILPPEEWSAWLDPDADAGAATALLGAARGNRELRATPVSRAVSDGMEGPECLEPAGEAVSRPAAAEQEPQGTLF